MGSARIYAKTPAGDEAVRQSTRVVQRNLRLVLVQVDGKLSVDELIAKIGNARLVESAINDLERGGFIVPQAEAAAAWAVGVPPEKEELHSAISQFSTFGERAPTFVSMEAPGAGPASVFSAFGKPVLPASEQEAPPKKRQKLEEETAEPGPGRQWRIFPLLGGAFMVLVALLVLLVFFFPYNNYRADLEQSAGKLLHMPVTIGEVEFVALPRPRLELHDLRLSGAGEETARIGKVSLPPPWHLLLKGGAAVTQLDLVDVSCSLDRLLMQPGVASDKAFALLALRQVNVDGLQVLAAKNTVLGPFNGLLRYENGHFVEGRLETRERELLIEAKPAAGQLALRIEGRAWQLPGTPVRFGALDAKATLDIQGLQVREIDASFSGGVLRGDWSLGWYENGLAMRGDLLLARVDLQQAGGVLPRLKLAGALEGPLRLEGSGASWADMWSAARLEMQAKVLRGNLFGVDLGEASRRGPGSVVRAGSTRFDQLTARVSADASGIALNELQLDAGALNAGGALRHTPDGRLEGRLTIQVRSSVAAIKVPVRVSGVLPNAEVMVER